jgi:hypothetical protein
MKKNARELLTPEIGRKTDKSATAGNRGISCGNKEISSNEKTQGENKMEMRTISYRKDIEVPEQYRREFEVPADCKGQELVNKIEERCGNDGRYLELIAAEAIAAEALAGVAKAKALHAYALFTQYRFAEAIQKMQEAAALDGQWQEEVDHWVQWLGRVYA